MVKCVHHINFLLNDLETAVKRYQEILGFRFHARGGFEPLQGISGWKLMDLEPDYTFGEQIRLTET